MSHLFRRSAPGLLLVVALVWLWLPGTGSASAFPPDIAAKAAIIVDDHSGRVLWEMNGHERRPPASITKIVTGIVALEHRRPSDIVRVRTGWEEMTDSTLMGLFKGEYLTVEDLLYGLMLMSGNDAAVELAREVGGSEANFVGMMNDKMAELGLTDSHFTNPHGLDHPDHYTSVHDITMIGRYAMRNPTFARVAGTREINRRGRWGYYPMRNLNRFLFTYPGVDGVKTGFTDNARQTLVASLNRDGRRYYLGLLASNYYPTEGEVLLNAFFEQYTPPTTVDESVDDPIGRRLPVADRHEPAPYRPRRLAPPRQVGPPVSENLY